jgi:hypothetical protein
MGSIEVARYQFHSWVRKGIATGIPVADKDDLGSGTATREERVDIAIPVSLNGQGHSKKFALIGPGDIIGLNRDMIVRTEPLNWVTDAEPNYLAFVEFYDEDFAWRYTPASPDGEKLRPWLFLLIVKETEFERTKRKVPLPSITVNTKDAFPPAEETWLWAHVHSNADIPGSESSDYEIFLRSLNNTFNDDPDQLYCRLMSPRKLEPETGYFAFLIPTFETGRLAGLELPTDHINAQSPSWNSNGPKGEMPVYFEWYFHTGKNTDFESLVKMLQPRKMDSRIGIRDMDCSAPGFVKADGTTPFPGTSPAIIGLEGALKAPSTISTKFPDPETSNAFQVELQKIVNLPVTIIGTNASGDPVISVPLYGGKHAKKSLTDVLTLDIGKDTWLHDLNKDPRTRTAAGLGTRVVQENQDRYMRKAWEQVQNIIEANRRIKATVLAMNVVLQFTRKTFNNLQGNVLLSVSRPVLSRIMGSPTTLYQQLRESRLPPVVFSGAFRKLVRAKISRRLKAGDAFNYDTLVTGLNDGKITAAPPKTIPAGVFTTQDLADKVSADAPPAWMQWLIKNRLWITIVLSLIFIGTAFLTGSFVLFGVLTLAAIAGYFYAGTQDVGKITAAEQLLHPQKEVESINTIPQRPDFTLILSNETTSPPATTTSPGADSVEAKNFRIALTDIGRRMAEKVPEKELKEFNIANAYAKVREGINPRKTFPHRLSTSVKFPGNISIDQPEYIFPAMAWPDIDEPMYKKLNDISSELLLPNLKLIPPNTISLLKTNQKFIESYMVGLNHEMGRELLWREYPTDERGSYFRQFWDVSGIIKPAENKTPAQLSEECKDIKAIHTWPLTSFLGFHNNRDAEGDAEQLVLVIRGDLLTKYPNTFIFAQKAIGGQLPDEPEIDRDLDDEEFRKHVRFPLYKAEIAPDIKFFGFDLTIEQARGTQLTPPFPDSFGWFFMIQQVPGEPQFGMDINFDAGSDGLSWDDLAWDQFGDDLKFIKASAPPAMDPETKKWGSDAATMAYILFQKPNLVAVHAKDMLENLNP